MKLFVLSLVLLIIVSCSKIYTMPMPDGSSVYYVTHEVGKPVIGPKLLVIDRWVYNPKTNTTILIRSDSSSELPQTKSSLPNIPVGMLP